MKLKFKEKMIFPSPRSVGKRDWGQEVLLALVSKKISLKKIILKKGKKGGLQYHHKKNECGYLVSGKLKIVYDLGNGKLSSKILKSGASFHFPPGLVHQEEALSKCEIIEASTPHFNDRVRVVHKYNIKNKKGLPSVNINEVILK